MGEINNLNEVELNLFGYHKASGFLGSTVDKKY